MRTPIVLPTSATGGKGNTPFAEPYVVSFCAHTDANDYVKVNGLLSMWRGYGDAGGFALVFDTKRLWRCIEPESKHYGYSAFYLADVVYDDQEVDFKEEFQDLILALEQFVEARAAGEDNPAGYVFVPFFNAVTRLKHPGFKEECEVRLTASPLSKGILKELAALEEAPPLPEHIKPIRSRMMRGSQSKYIIINDPPQKMRKSLPIVKIIVGPQRDQERRANEIKKLLGKKRIAVVCSKTPYIPA